MEIHAVTTHRNSALLPFALCLLPFALTPSSAVTDGYVVRIESSTLYLDWGKDSGVKRGDSFEVYSPGPELKHPVTGEILGRARAATGSGVLTSIEEKFSLGQLIQSMGKGPEVGQRTALGVPSVAPAAPLAAPVPATGNMPAERWHSEPMKGEPASIVVGDVDGDGRTEIVAAFFDRIEIFRWTGQALESAAIWRDRSEQNWVAVDILEAMENRKAAIVASGAPHGVPRGRTVILEWANGALQETSRLDGFVRRIPRANQGSMLVWQGLSQGQQYKALVPAALEWAHGKYRPGSTLKFPRDLNDDQLFGFLYGDWDADGHEDFAFLQRGDKLRIFFDEAQWSSTQPLGGTQNSWLFWRDELATLYPRVLTLTPGSGKPVMLVPHNIPKLGIRTQHFKFYDQSELVALQWNGMTMGTLWTLPFQAYFSDFTIGDVMGAGRPQLWVMLGAPGKKTIFAAYDLP